MKCYAMLYNVMAFVWSKKQTSKITNTNQKKSNKKNHRKCQIVYYVYIYTYIHNIFIYTYTHYKMFKCLNKEL